MLITLSFCIQIRDRLPHLKQTLRQNLSDNWGDRNYIEFIVLDLASEDGLENFILSNFRNELDCGYLKYYRVTGLGIYHASIAKNLAHQKGNGNYLINLDADNYTGYRGGAYLKSIWETKPNAIIHQWSGKYFDGTYGRIGIPKAYFEAIGGYDESLEAVGFEDDDLLLRAKGKFGERVFCTRPPWIVQFLSRKTSKYSRAIKNEKPKQIMTKWGPKTWKEVRALNRSHSLQNVKAKRWVANTTVLKINHSV